VLDFQLWIFICACNKLDHIKNEDTRKELKTRSGQNKKDEYIQNRINHLERMLDEREKQMQSPRKTSEKI
jgi:hypothetical protein